MAAPRVLIFSVSAGAGHVRAAEALRATAAALYPAATVQHVDLMTLVGRVFRQVYAESYIKLVERHPALWGYLYAQTDQQTEDSRLRRLQMAVERLSTTRILACLRDAAPHHVICTHFLPAQLLARLRRHDRWHHPVWVQITDYDVHRLWLHEGLSGYFAGNEEVAFRVRARLPAAAVEVTGIPIMPAFAAPPARAACRAELGLAPDRRVLLLMAGGAGVGSLDTLAARLLAEPDDWLILALAGRNQALLDRLRALAAQHPGRLQPHPFTTTPERFMQASDLAITKPGGLTTSECLALGLPMVLISPIPGQEERNADFLLESGAALKAMDADAVVYRVRALGRAPARLAALRTAAAALGRPHAAASVLRRVLGPPPA